MKVPLEWLKAYVTVRLSPEVLAKRLTMAGLEVVGMERVDGEVVFDLEVTPNRPDWLSIIGVAREVAVITKQRLKLPGLGKGQPAASRAPGLRIQIEDRRGCSRYLGRLLEGVTVGPSPTWLQRRLIACGARPINNVVDVTNYVLFEGGQPLHAFDLATLAEGTVLVRRARPGEPITTLDGVSRQLDAEMLVIADARRAVAVAGIMGGVGSEVTDRTTRLLLESALFEPRMIRRTARRLGLASESSYRFERGVDPAGMETASRRAEVLLCELTGGRVVAVKDVGRHPVARRAIVVDAQRIGRRLGIRVDGPTLRTTFARLGCRVSGPTTSGGWQVTPPSFRQDLQQEVDLSEELVRVIGYDQLPATIPVTPLTLALGGAATGYDRLHALRELCASLGLMETITWGLIAPHDLTPFGFSLDQATRLANPLSADHSVLRPSLIIGLVQTIQRNLAQGALGVRVFELGSIVPLGKASGREVSALGLGVVGLWQRDWRVKEPADFFTLKGLLGAIVERCCGTAAEWSPAERPWSAVGQGAEIRVAGQVVGFAGQLARRIAETLNVEPALWLAELSVEALLAAPRASTVSASAPTVVPPVKRDLSFLVDRAMAFATVDRILRETGGLLASRIELIDRYTGPQVPEDKASLTVSIQYRDAQRTLTADEAEALHQRIRQALVDRCQAQLR